MRVRSVGARTGSLDSDRHSHWGNRHRVLSQTSHECASHELPTLPANDDTHCLLASGVMVLERAFLPQENIGALLALRMRSSLGRSDAMRRCVTTIAVCADGERANLCHQLYCNPCVLEV